MSETLAYCRKTPMIYDIVLSGGEPLALSNEQIRFVFCELSSLENVQSVRFCTYSVIKDPGRIDSEFLGLLKRFGERFSIRMVLHMTHPDELSEEVKRTIKRLLESGTLCLSQVPLLKGININDDIEASRSLLRGLLRKLDDFRIQPYYFLVKMAVPGTTDYAMPLEKIVEIFKPLLQHDRDSTGLGLTLKLVAAAPETKVFIYPETIFRYSNTLGGYVISADEKDVFLPYEDLAFL